MLKKALISFAFAALSVASAATYHVTLVDTQVGRGQQVKAGDYQLEIKDNAIVLVNGGKKVEVSAKIENGAEKFKKNRVIYNRDNGKLSVQEIQVGGTTQKLTFDSGVQSGGGE